jgi:hypothetical protein
MWKLATVKQVFLVVGLVGILAFSAPSLALLLQGSKGESFSELYILGPGHMAEGYPFNVEPGQDYSLFVGVIDHLSRAAYYEVQVKLRNASEPLPNATTGVWSSVPALYRFRVFAVDGGTWEDMFSFRFLDVVSGENVSHVGRIVINNIVYDVNKTIVWDAVNSGYYCQIFLELWLYDVVSSDFQYHNRFVGLWLNVTMSA